MNDAVIQAQGLSRNFDRVKAVQELDLEVSKGQIYGFLGPNGSGKTTAIRMLTGLLQPSAGSIRVLGFELPRDADKLRMQIGYMTQRFSLYDDLTVEENLEFVSSIYGLSGRSRRQRIDELLDLYGLKKHSHQLSGSMSGGQRQRLSLVAATLHRPKLLFLDEPTSAVDPENRRDFWEQLFDLSDQGASILVSTHYMDEAERCHRLAILDSGVKRVDGAPEDLIHGIGAQVVEITTDSPRRIKNALTGISDVISTAQLGARLRVLVKDSIDDPVAHLQQHLALQAEDSMTVVRASLEDVFVTSTHKPA